MILFKKSNIQIIKIIAPNRLLTRASAKVSLFNDCFKFVTKPKCFRCIKTGQEIAQILHYDVTV